MDAHIIDGLERKFNSFAGDLDEQGRQRWAATEAIAFGFGGISVVAIAKRLFHHAIWNGINELESGLPLPILVQA